MSFKTQKTELLVPSAWINPCCGINLIHIASHAIFETLCRRNVNIIEQSELGIGQRSMLICLIIASRNQNQMDISYWPHLIYIYIYIYTSYVCLLCFLLALNFVFSKRLLFILFVIKQLLCNLTSVINIYSAKPIIIRRGKAK